MEIPATANLPTKYGLFRVMVWPASKGEEPVAILTPELDVNRSVSVRIHSECLTGDVFGSYRCDCCDQKEEALREIAKSGNGVFIYLRQEGRGMGLFDKIRSYKLQEEGVDTHEASMRLGHEPDSREYSMAKKILEELGVKKIKLLTNNPAKVSEIFDAGFDVVKTPLVIKPTKYNAGYFDTKRKKFKHTFGEKERYHFYGLSYSDYETNVEELLFFLRTKRVHPLLKFHLGLYVDHAILEDSDKSRVLKNQVDKIGAEKNVIAVLHYSSEASSRPEKDIKTIAKLFPSLTCIQINNATENYISLLEKVPTRLAVIAPLSETNFGLIDNPRFRDALTKRQSFILLDNSKGTGKTEDYESYQKKVNRCLNYGLNNLGVAGGFGPDNLETYFKLKQYFKIDFSIDAESKLQTDGRLDIGKAETYFDQLLA